MQQGRPREFDPDEVLERAMHVFWERGYEATPVSELVEELGIGRQSLYSTFGDKRALFEAALALYAERRIGPIVAALEAPGSPLGNLDKVLTGLAEEGTQPDFRGCMIVHSISEFSLRDPELAACLTRHLRRLEDAFARTLQRAQQAGELSAEKKPRALARTIVTSMQGLTVMAVATRSKAYIRDVLSSLRSLLV